MTNSRGKIEVPCSLALHKPIAVVLYIRRIVILLMG